MKRILLLSLLLLPIVALAQYPTFSNKQKLGVQTTGDGLIYRGNNNPNYNPSNINNAYFYLDTTASKLYLYSVGTWQQVYPTAFDTSSLNIYLKISDTTAMLLPYFRDSDTTSLNLINRFALKLNISDTITMLTPYMKKADTISLSNRINLKLNISDTIILSNRITTNANNIITINNKLATKLDTIYTKFKDVVKMIVNKDTINIGSSLTDGYAINIIGDSVNVDTTLLDIRYPDRDSTNELQDITFATTSGVITISGSKVMNLDTLYNSVIDSVNLLIRDSIAAFTPLTEGYGINIIGDSINVDTSIIFTQSDTITLSNRIDLKLNTSDTITLSNRIDTKLNASDTASLSNRINLKLNISDTTNMLAPYLKEADTINLSNRINTKIDTIYVNYQTNVDVITNKDTINITPLTEGFGINIIADSINIDSAVILATQQKQIAYVKNSSGVTMYKGQAVYSSGSSGDNKLVTLASSNTEQASSKTFGIVETDSIPNGGHGYIITFGVLNGFNTDALTEGSSVYLSSTPGQLTSVKPQAPLHIVTIGVCIRKQQNNGSIFVKIQNGFEFDELHDVRLTDLVDKSSIYYNLSEKLWRDTTPTLLVSDTASMLNPYLRKLDTITLSNRIDLKFNTADTSILGYVTTYSNQLNINGNKTFNNTVSVDSLNATKQAKIQSLTVGKGGYAIIGGTPGGISSTAFGFEALKNNTSGDWNTAIGYQTLLNNTTAWNNVAIGNNSLNLNTVGEYNTAIGVESLFSNKVGNNNVAIGYYAGTNNKGNNNIYIGNQTYHTDSVNNVLMIGGINTPLLSGITTGNKKLGINKNPLTLTHTFEVNSPISDAVKISSNTNSTNFELANNSGNSVFIKSTNRNMVLQTDTTALMYLNGETNRVGILTMTPEQALEVNGTIRVDSLVNSLTPDKLVGANNANDLTDIKIGNGLSFSNDTLKVADNIINSGDTATLLRKDFLGINTNVLVWTEGNKKLLPYFTQVYRNGQLLKSDSQYTITSDSIVTLEEGSYRLGDNITIIAIDNIVALAGSGGIITLQGDVTGSGTNTITTTIGTNKVTNTMLAGSISNDKLNTITATNKVSNSATTATDANTANHIVLRDNAGNFSAGTITATLNGNASTATNVAYSGLTGTVPTWNQNTTGNAATVTTNANLIGDVTSTGNATSIATGVIVNADINASAAIAVSKLAASTISGVTLGNNLNTLTISSPLTGTSYNGFSSVTIGIQAATTSVAGSMSAADKTKLDGIAAGAQVNVSTNLAQGTRTTTTVPITSSTGTTATLDIATTSLAGVMSSADKTKLDGIASGATANTGTVTSVAALTLTTTGTDITSSVANSTTTPVITLNVPNASTTNRGVLTSTDWTTFNSKQNNITPGTTGQYFRGDKTFQTLDKSAVGLGDVNNTTDLNKPVSTATQTALNGKQNTLTNPVTGTGTNNYIPKFTTTGSTIGNSVIQESASNIGIGKTPEAKLDINGDIFVNGTSYNFNNVNNRNGYLYFDHSGVQVWKFGLFNDNSSTLSLGNGGNFNRIFNIANNGNIGINDTTPSYSLDINGGFASNGLFRFGGATNYLMQNFDDRGFYSEIYGTTSNNRHIRFQGLNDAQTKYTSINLYAGVSTIMFRTDEYNKMELTNNLLVINEDSQDTDFRVESDGNVNMLFVDGTNNRVGIGYASPTKELDVNGELRIGTVSTPPTALLGKDGSNVVGTVTTVAQTGLFGRGSVTNEPTDANGIITVAHGFGFTPIMAFANLPGSTTNIVNVKEVDGINIVFVVRDGATNSVLNTQTVNKIEFFAIK